VFLLLFKNKGDHKMKREEIIRRLNNEGFKVKVGKRTSENGYYFGIISRQRKILMINIPI
jgi:hypothetical protein